MDGEHNLLVLERQILGKISEPFKAKEGWRIINNRELQKLINGEDVVLYIGTKNIIVGIHVS